MNPNLARADWRWIQNGYALVLSLIVSGTTIALGDPQIAANRLVLETLAFPEDTTPIEGQLDVDPKHEGIELSQADAERALDTMCAAARSRREGVRSVIAKARFANWSRGPDEKEPQLITAGRLQLYGADGKYHLKFTHEKMLQRTTYVPQGVFRSKVPGEEDVFRNEAGEVVDVPAKMVDWKADNVFIVNDGRNIISTVLSPRLRPDGVRSESHTDFQDACIRRVGMYDVDPARLVNGVGELEAIVKNLGREAIQIKGLPNGGFRAIYHLKNAPQVKVELDAFEKDGFNVSSERVFNEGEPLPATAERATWRKVNNQWVVSKIQSENRYRASKHHAYRKEVVAYYSLEINPWVDPKAFTTSSMSVDWQPRASADE